MFLTPALVAAAMVVGQAEAKVTPATSAEHVQKAVSRSLAYLDKSAVDWWNGNTQNGVKDGKPVLVKGPQKNCASCHHVPMTLWCLTEAKNRGFAVDNESLDQFRDWSFPPYVKHPDFKPVNQDKFEGGKVGTKLSLNTIYLSLAAAADTAPDEATRDAVKKFAGHIMDKQEADGSWKAGRTGYEPPIGDVTEVLTLQALLVLAIAHDKGLVGDRWPQARERALEWLKKNKPSDDLNQSLTMRALLAQRLGKPDELQALLKQLVQMQNPDGGWHQTKDRPSDVLATGQNLYVLAVTGADASNKEAVERAKAYLLRTQLKDGSWWVDSRDKGRKGLAISHYGSGWATLGLIRTTPALAQGTQTAPPAPIEPKRAAPNKQP